MLFIVYAKSVIDARPNCYQKMNAEFVKEWRKIMKGKKNALIELIAKMTEEQFKWFIVQAQQELSCADDQQPHPGDQEYSLSFPA